MDHISTLQQWIGSKIGCDAASYNRFDLERYQLQRLQHTIQYARAKSPFYRQLFQNSPDFPVTLQELSLYPFTKPEDIQADPNRFICVTQDEINRIVTLPTSGTTGPSKRIFFSAQDQELTIDFFKVGMANLAKAGDRVLILLPAERPGSVGDLLAAGLQRLGCIPFKYGPVDDEQKILELIRSEDINVLVGAPVHMYRLACRDRADTILPAGQIRSVLTSTDYLPQVIKTKLMQFWNCEVFDHYGMTETGLGGGVECSVHQGYHLREADLFFEVVDPVSGATIPNGILGEVVVTTLTRTGMPLIRYRTGDLSRLIPDECQCGSFIKRLEKIRARVHSGIQLESGVIFQSELDEALFQMDGLVDFSVKMGEELGCRRMTLEIYLIKGTIKEMQVPVLELLGRIPVLRNEMTNGNLKVVLSQMETILPGRTGYMFKRVIQVKQM